MIHNILIPRLRHGQSYTVRVGEGPSRTLVSDGRVEQGIVDKVVTDGPQPDFQERLDTASIRQLVYWFAGSTGERGTDEATQSARNVLGPRWQALSIDDSSLHVYSPNQTLVVDRHQHSLGLTTRDEDVRGVHWEHWISGRFDDTGRLLMEGVEESARVFLDDQPSCSEFTTVSQAADTVDT